MMGFTEYIESQGYVRHKYNGAAGFVKTNEKDYSALGTICYTFFHAEQEPITYGLNEKGMPPCLSTTRNIVVDLSTDNETITMEPLDTHMLIIERKVGNDIILAALEGGKRIIIKGGEIKVMDK